MSPHFTNNFPFKRMVGLLLLFRFEDNYCDYELRNGNRSDDFLFMSAIIIVCAN